MDKILGCDISTILDDWKSDVINIKHLKNTIFHIKPSLTLEELSCYLEKIGYLTLSSNYMIKSNYIIEYCKTNNIQNIFELQRLLFINHGIPYINVDNYQVNSIIKETGNCHGYETKNIVIKDKEDYFTIDNIQDLIDFGLENTYVSYSLIDNFCSIYSNFNHLEVKYILNDRDIKITSDNIKFDVISIEYPIIAKDKKHINNNKKIIMDINLENNIIINLRLNEIIATFINLGYENGYITKRVAKNKYKPNHIREFKKMGLLTIDDNNNYAYNITDECLRISEKLKSTTRINPDINLFMDKKIMTEENIDYFYEIIKDEFLEVINKFDNFKFIIKMLNILKDNESVNMMNIIEYCVLNNYQKEYVTFFLGSQGTSGKIPLKNGRDICCIGLKEIYNNQRFCKQCYLHHGINKSNIQSKLMSIRNYTSGQKYQQITNNYKLLDSLLEDPLTVKFLVRFGVIFHHKNILRALKIINTKPYLKSHGEYCPYIDEWRFKNEI